MESLAEENARLRQEVVELKSANERLERRVQELLRTLEEAHRAGKRQAAPFSRHKPKARPSKPGRKAGARYGRRCRRPIPSMIDQTLEAELPGCCPHCGGELEETEIEKQYQTEILQPRVEYERISLSFLADYAFSLASGFGMSCSCSARSRVTKCSSARSFRMADFNNTSFF